jgi:hypothetical protein
MIYGKRIYGQDIYEQDRGELASVAFAVVNPAPVAYRTDSEPITWAVEIGQEIVNIGKWVYHGKRLHAVARWGYSPRLDTVFIREVRTAHNWAIYCDQCTESFVIGCDVPSA